LGKCWLTKLNAAGSGLVYSTYLGGSNVDYGQGVAVDSLGSAYVTGYTQSTNPRETAVQRYNFSFFPYFFVLRYEAGAEAASASRGKPEVGVAV
jgi:hypothetical protein